MSRAAIRAAVASYLAGAGVDYLSTVNPHPPKITTADQFFSAEAPGTASGAVVFVHLKEQREWRIALGGLQSGVKRRVYQVLLICLFRSQKLDTVAVGADCDTFLDSLTAAIQADRMAGDPQQIFQWGEGDGTFGVDIHVNADFPRPIRLQGSQVYAEVEVAVVELLET